MTYTKELEALKPGDKVFIVNHERRQGLNTYRLGEVAKRIKRSSKNPPNIKLTDGSEWTYNGNMAGNNLWSSLSLVPVNEETKRANRRCKLCLQVQNLASVLRVNTSPLSTETLEELIKHMKKAVSELETNVRKS